MLQLLLIAQLFTGGLGPVVSGSDPRLQSARACEGCHEGEHAEWVSSRHGQAYTNPIFQREYSARPEDWCVHCHAPLDAQLKEARSGGGALVKEGVNCASCHVRGDRIVAAAKRADSPHDTQIVAGFGEAAFCAGCHQFNFPRLDDDRPPRERVVGYTALPMQNTVVEHAHGPHADKGCRSCHTSPSNHLYPGGHDPAMLGRALSMTVCRERDELVATVTNRGAGHRVPTGDVHRHLALRLWKPGAPEHVRELFLVRRYRPLADGGKELLEDTGLAPGQSRALRAPIAALGDPGDATIAAELRFVYTTDEFPQHEIGEPAFATVATTRARLGDLPRCGHSRAAVR